MRRIVIFDRVSADGYFAGADGNLEWVVQDEELDQRAAGHLGTFDTILFGRRTYEQFESFWPHVIDEAPTAPSPHGEARRSRELRAMGVWINQATKIVFSRTRKEVTWSGSRLAREVDPRAIEDLKRGPGHDIIVFGSGQVVSQLTQHGLIDEYQFVVSPILLGSGRSLLGGVPEHTRLALAEARTYPTGNVMLRYTRAG